MEKEINVFNKMMIEMFSENKRFLLKRPSYIPTIAKIVSKMREQAEKRMYLSDSENIVVPPIMIMSITNDCNLRCKGCYACAQERDKSEEMSANDFIRVTQEAVDLGVSVIMIAGGEPLTKKEILSVTENHPNTLFVLFTNGLLIDETLIAEFRQRKNLIPIISLEGDIHMTDARRGKGIYDKVLKTMKDLDQKKVLYGTSITLTKDNFDEILKFDYLKSLEDIGCRVAFLIEYVPSDGNFDPCLNDVQKEELRLMEIELAKKHHMMIVSLPGDEEQFGGCMAAGRGFIHLSSTGSLEACPFAPYSDINLKEMSLKEALESKLLREIRENHHMLTESRGGCALVENKEWVESLLKTNKELLNT